MPELGGRAGQPYSPDVGWKLVPDGPAAARTIRWINSTVTVLAAAISAFFVRWFFPLFVGGWVALAIVAAIAGLGWFLRGRLWSTVFLSASILLALLDR